MIEWSRNPKLIPVPKQGINGRMAALLADFARDQRKWRNQGDVNYEFAAFVVFIALGAAALGLALYLIMGGR